MITSHSPNVNCKPRFETPLRSTTVLYIGRRGELLVELNGVPAPTVAWTLNNVPLKESDRIHVEYLSDGWYKLAIEDVNYDDNGVYKVIATNEHGERESETLVHVELGPPIISSLCKSDIKLKRGDKLCIVVSIKDYGTDYHVQWFKNLQPISSGGDDEVKITKKRHMCSLKIDSVELHETGQYKCVVSSVGETSVKFNVEVKEETKETDDDEEEEEAGDMHCHDNSITQNKSLCNKSASLNDLLESPSLQADIRKASLDSTRYNVKNQGVKEGRTKGSNCPDIYTSLTPSSKRNALRSKNLFSCVRLKAFFRDSLHFKKQKSNRTLYKSKSISHFPDGSNKENRIEHFDDMAPHTDENISENDTSLQLRSTSLPDLIDDENDTNEKNTKTELQSPAGVKAKSRRSRSLVSSMKHSISRRFSRRKSCVEPEDKHTPPPKLIKFSRKQNNWDSGEQKENDTICHNEARSEDELNINDLTHEDKETMEQKLHVLIFGSLKWQLLTARLCEKGLIDIEQEEIEICKYPYRLNIGRRLIENILQCKPDINIDEFIDIAQNRNRVDICLLLRTFNCLRLHDVTAVERQKLEILCSYQTTFSGYTWKLLAQDFELSEECINSIEETLYSPTPPSSSFEEILNIFRTRNPSMTLKCIVGTLRELHFDESADILEYIISEKRK